MCHLIRYIESCLGVLLISCHMCMAQPVLCDKGSRGTNPFHVAESVECDAGYNNLLGRYLYQCMKGESVSSFDADSLAALFTRPSFSDIVQYFLTPDYARELNVMYPDSQMTWDDTTIGLLVNCSNEKTVYSVVDSLLKDGIGNGLPALWDNCDFSRLKFYSAFKRSLKSAPGEVEELSGLVFMNHNSDNRREVKNLLKRVSSLSPVAGRYLARTIHDKGKIDYIDYLYYHLNVVLDLR